MSSLNDPRKTARDRRTEAAAQRCRTLAVVALLALTTWAAPVLATPAPDVQDDAGSGGDAGDTSDLALGVGNGDWTGTILDPVDINDWYRLRDVQAGQRIHVSLASDHDAAYLVAELYGPQTGAPDGDPAMYRRTSVDGAFELPIAVEGPWHLRVTRLATPVGDQSPAVDYTFTVQSQPDPDLSHHVSDTTALSESIEWSEPAHLAAYVRIETPVDPTRPTAGAILLEHDVFVDGVHDRDFRMYAFESGGTGSPDIERIHLAGDGPTSAPEVLQTVGVDISVTYLAISWPETAGTVRWTAYMTAPGATVSLAASVGPHASTRAEATTPVSWTTEDSVAKQNVANGPGLQVVAPDRLELDTGNRFIGLFDTHDVDGHAVAPDGTRHDVVGGRYLFLLAPSDGTWTFHLDGRTDTGREAVTTYLHGVHVPIADDMATLGAPLPA